MRLLGLALSLLAAPATGLCSGPAAGADSAPPAAAAPRAENTTPAPEDRLGFLRTLTIDGDETARDAVCVFCPVVVRGTVQRDAVAVWGGVDVEGQVGVDAVALGGALRVARGARVGGDPVALGGPVEADPGGILAEEPSALPWLLLPGQREVFAIGALVFVGAHLLLALAGAVLLGERRVAHLAALWRWSPGRALLVGCGAFTLVVALISLGGTLGEGSAAVAGILGALFLAGAFAVGMPGVATVLAHRVRSGLGWRGAVVGGTLAIAVLSLVPVAGLGGAGAGAESREALAEEVQAREIAFAKTMADRDHAAFSTFVSEEALFLGATTLRGREAVARGWRPFFDGPRAPFSWEPERVEVTDSGTLAISTGPVRSPAGERIGTFNSTWRLEADGQWRVVLDIGCPPCRCPESPAETPDE